MNLGYLLTWICYFQTKYMILNFQSNPEKILSFAAGVTPSTSSFWETIKKFSPTTCSKKEKHNIKTTSNIFHQIFSQQFFINLKTAGYVLTHFNTENLSYVYGLYVANMTNIHLHKTNDSKINSYCTEARAVDTYDKISRVLFSKCFGIQLIIDTVSLRSGPNVDSHSSWHLYYPLIWLYTLNYRDRR